MADGKPIIIGQPNTENKETSLSRDPNSTSTEPVFTAETQVEGHAIHGVARSGYGVLGESRFGPGVYASSDSGDGLIATSNQGGNGVDAESNSGPGVRGTSFSSGPGVYGLSSSGPGVRGSSDTLYGVIGLSTSGRGVYGSVSTSGSAKAGVFGQSFPPPPHVPPARAVWGLAPENSNVAGYFDGGITVVHGIKAFKIDHPLDPQNKYLLHNAVESSETTNVYDGVAWLDEDGAAWVELPEWFEALNGDFRYQLTAVGGPAPNLYVAEEVSENRFKIAGGEEGMKVCWQVTGSRKDPWAAANPFEVEQEKPEEERGRYLDPSLYDAPEEQRLPEPSGIDLARVQEEHRREMDDLRRRMEERQEEAPPEST